MVQADEHECGTDLLRRLLHVLHRLGAGRRDEAAAALRRRLLGHRAVRLGLDQLGPARGPSLNRRVLPNAWRLHVGGV